MTKKETTVLSVPLVRSVQDMTAQQNVAFSRLLGAWNQHQGLRRGHASIRELADSRRILDEARIEAMRFRG